MEIPNLQTSQSQTEIKSRTEPIAVEPTVPAPPVAAPVAAPAAPAAPAEGLRARPGSGRRSSRNLLAEPLGPVLAVDGTDGTDGMVDGLEGMIGRMRMSI